MNWNDTECLNCGRLNPFLIQKCNFCGFELKGQKRLSDFL